VLVGMTVVPAPESSTMLLSLLALAAEDAEDAAMEDVTGTFCTVAMPRVTMLLKPPCAFCCMKLALLLLLLLLLPAGSAPCLQSLAL
jgi:hypothetical protein